jgi:hypothetical protein
MGGTCSTYGVNKCVQRFNRKNCGEETASEETGRVGVEWIQMTHDTVQWQALVNTVMNRKVI